MKITREVATIAQIKEIEVASAVKPEPSKEKQIKAKKPNW